MMLKMAAVALLLLCCFIASTASKDACQKYAAEGQTIAMPFNHKLQASETLKWKLNDTTIFHKKPEKGVITGEKDDVYQNGSLKLTNLQKSQEGKYTPEVHKTDGKLITSLNPTVLCILESFPDPEVTIKCTPTTIIFSCNIGKGVPDVTFKWRWNKKEWKEKTQKLTLKAEGVELEDSFECEVSNRALSKTSKAVQQMCSNPKLFGLDFWIMIIILAGGGGLVLLLIIIVIVCCVRNRKKKSMKVKDEEELRLGWSSSEQHQHHHHHHHHDQHNHPPGHHHSHHHHQQQPAGHTGPRQHRHKQHRDPRSKVPDPPNGQPQPSPRRAAQAPTPVNNYDDEQPPPLPQPRKKAPKSPRV